MNKKRIVIFLALFAILGIGNMGIFSLLPTSGQNGGVQAPLGNAPSTADAGDLVRNPYFDGTWQNDWASSVVATSVVKQQSVSTHAEHHSLNWFSCETHVDENFASSSTSRDDGSLSFVEGVALSKVGSGTSSALRYQAHLFSSGYARAQAGDSTWTCSDSEASVSWTLDDTVTYTRRITENLNNYGNTNPLTYAVFSGKYKMLSTMSGSDVWHAKVTFKLEAPDTTVQIVSTEYFESQVLNGVERSFNEDVKTFMSTEGVGVYKYIIEFEFSMHHEDTRSDSQSGNGATAVTPSITYDDYVSLDFYGARLVWTATLSPPTLTPITPNPDTDGQVVLSWNQVPVATVYNIYRNSSPIFAADESIRVVTVTGGSTTTWTDPSAPRGVNYYVISAGDGMAWSPLSANEQVEVILKPAAISDLVVPATDDAGEFTINWGASPDGQSDGYKIYMNTTSFSDLTHQTVYASTDALSYTVGPVNNGRYYFAVVGTNIAGDGPISTGTHYCDVTIVTKPAPVTWVTANQTVHLDRVTLQWLPRLGALYYSLYRNTTHVLDTTLTEFTDYNLQNWYQYIYTVTATNYIGESDPSEALNITCKKPNVFNQLGAWLTSLDPMLYNIIQKAVGVIINAVPEGQEIYDYLTGQGGTMNLDFTLGIGEYTITAGVKLKLDLHVKLTASGDYILFEITPQTMTTFTLNDMQLGGSFGEVAGMLSKLGISVTPTIYLAGKIAFNVNIYTGAFQVTEIAIEFKPKVVVTLNVLKLILSVCAPEAEPVVSTIASLIDKFTGYDIYDIITAQLTITLDVIARYFPATQRTVLDIILDVKLDAIRINFAQPRKNDHYEMVAGLVGQAGVHWQTGSDLTWCGYLYFFLTFDFQDVKISLVRNILQQAVDWTGLSYDQPNIYYLVGSAGSACAPISLSGPSPASGPDSDNDYLDDTEDPAPLLPDGDGDGLWDYLELDIESDPLVADTDGDGLIDSEEYTLGTNASQADTDSDGLPDGVELAMGTNPCSADTDGDLLTDSEEIAEGTDPLEDDTDQDGVSDGWEVQWYDSDPLSPASVPADVDNDQLANKDEMYLFQTNPNFNDAEDSDGDGLSNAAENIFFGSNPYLEDSDDDGLNDKIEIDNGIYYMDPDSDSDRLLDGEEFLIYGTDPEKADTDNDGYTDYLETIMGSDPLNFYNIPKETKIEDYAVIWAFFIGVGVACGVIFAVWGFQRYFGNPLRGLKLRGAAANAIHRVSRRIRGKSAPKPLPEGVQGPAEKEPTYMEQKAKSKLRIFKRSKKPKGFWGKVQT